MRQILSGLLSVAAIALAGPLAAEDLTPAQQATKAELAARLGVDAAGHTLHELSVLTCRVSGAENDREKARLIRDFNTADLTPPPTSRVGHEQMAEMLGVSADDYTTAQLVLLRALSEDESCNVPDPLAYARGDERLTPTSAAAKNQLALSMGVDPTEYSLVELVKMHESDDN